ncbi:MAG: nucleoside hydrolase [Chloroflexota bacterium]|nr:nucleoside hydrolase [Chloroflexota bacterium]
MAADGAFPLLLDVDTGVDDALALALAVSSPEAHLVGVTTLAGNVPVEAATENTLRVLGWCGADGVPVFRGASRPLVAEYRSATHVHGDNGLGGAELPAASRDAEQQPGPGALIRLAEEYAGELVVVALGPLTNLAIALNVRPELPRLIRRLIVMGGAYEVPGNVTPVAEFNIFVDPHAANFVFEAPWPSLVAVGLDVTHQAALSRRTWEAIPDGATGAPGLVRHTLQHTFTGRDKTGMYLHDPLAVAVALNPTFVETVGKRVIVETEGEFRGRTTAIGDGDIGVAISVRADDFSRWFGERLALPPGDPKEALRRAD